MCELWKYVGLLSLLGQEGNIDEACVSSLDLCFVGKLNEYSVVGGNAFGAGVVNVQEMTCASCVGNGVLICGRRTVVGISWATNVVTAMSSLGVCIRPCLSRDFLFVGGAASFGVGSCGIALVALARKVATLTGVGVVDIESMGPAVVGVRVAALGRVTVSWGVCVAVSIVGAIL